MDLARMTASLAVLDDYTIYTAIFRDGTWQQACGGNIKKWGVGLQEDILVVFSGPRAYVCENPNRRMR